MALQQLLAVAPRNQLHDHGDPVRRREAATPAHNVRMVPEILEQLGLVLQQLAEPAPSGTLAFFLSKLTCARPPRGTVGGDVHHCCHAITKPCVAEVIEGVKGNLAVERVHRQCRFVSLLVAGVRRT